MFRMTPGRIAAAAAVFAGLLLVWAEVSAAWVALAQGVTAALSHGALAVNPPGAPIVLPVVCGAIVTVDVPLSRRLFWLGVVLVATFGCELALVAAWAVTGAPPSLIVVPGDAGQVVLPIAVLALAASEARASTRV